MGNARWDPDTWLNYASRASTRTRSELFTASALDPSFDPAHIGVRESRDSDTNPRSTPIAIALDVTGSMGAIPHELIKGGLGTLAQEIINRKPVTDPHLMFLGVGDVNSDRAPLQATQFEADVSIADQLTRLYLEGNGGGNDNESYHLPWLFAATRTALDSFEKRGEKGLLFTIGDEQTPEPISSDQIRRVLGNDTQLGDLNAREILEMAERSWDIFHVVVEEGSHCQNNRARVMSDWTDLLGQRVIPLSDYKRLAEVIVSAIEVHAAGRNHADVAHSWSGETNRVVEHAVSGLPTRSSGDTGGGIVHL